MAKPVLSIFLIALVVCGLTFTGDMNFGVGSASTSVIGVLTVDTVWTKVSSPYTLTGPVKVEENTTLTIEPGVTVNLGSYYILVVGTLSAVGSTIDPIRFNGGVASPSFAITFTEGSKAWNEQTGTGCIIENAVIESRISCEGSVKINSCTINAAIVVGHSTIVSNSIITQGISTNRGSPVIVNNTISGGVSMSIFADSPVISNNSITGGDVGVVIGSGSVYVSDNVISNCKNAGIVGVWGRAVIERNLITNNPVGIDIPFQSNLTIKNNTITNNEKGMSISKLSPDINYNNIQGNTQYSIYLDNSESIDATNNWWGTTDAQAINQTIRDNKYDFTIGTVNFTPFLIEPNLQALPNYDPTRPPAPSPTHSPTPTLTAPSQTSTPTSTPTSITTPNESQVPTSMSPPISQSSTASPDQTGIQPSTQSDFDSVNVAILIVLVVIAVLLAANLALALKKKR